MSYKINAREVLSYLNQLGYTNINAVQLQAFMKDLKKLMKYEELRINEPALSDAKLVKINIIKDSIGRNLCESEKLSPDALFVKSNENVCHSEYLSGLIGRENISPLPERPITVPLTKQKKIDEPINNYVQSSKPTIICPVHCFKRVDSSERSRQKTANIACNCPIEVGSQFCSPSDNDKNIKKMKRPFISTVQSKNWTVGTQSNPESFNDYPKHSVNRKKPKKLTGNCNHDFSHLCNCSESMRPHSAVIKCNTESVPPFQKCDPVNLHKYYQRQWKINKIPGENMSKERQFRWCFRERISCGPPAKK